MTGHNTRSVALVVVFTVACGGNDESVQTPPAQESPPEASVQPE
jgi:hypothetical protein